MLHCIEQLWSYAIGSFRFPGLGVKKLRRSEKCQKVRDTPYGVRSEQSMPQGVKSRVGPFRET